MIRRIPRNHFTEPPYPMCQSPPIHFSLNFFSLQNLGKGAHYLIYTISHLDNSLNQHFLVLTSIPLMVNIILIPIPHGSFKNM